MDNRRKRILFQLRLIDDLEGHHNVYDDYDTEWLEECYNDRLPHHINGKVSLSPKEIRLKKDREEREERERKEGIFSFLSKYWY